ncbi:hypothetical protein Athai_58080 [Actinocatenispora thailandica]|uniref:Uncharacterized protein n=1 Tax=Actinocatenispora thailandica TaxID=227318 RepID=A0A7R7DUY1_9ACTN|nr:hypothetical protein [Actinocatenispora thailandica]BCJ38305.1 hypothetical protein Athai_58080 [Actinocatenispora thailandica]
MDVTPERRPDPSAATTAAEFLAALRGLRAWAGQPSLRAMTALAGVVEVPNRPPNDVLPVSTLSDNLAGKRLPNLSRESFVEAYVRACLRASGADDAATAAAVEEWCAARRALAARIAAPAVPTAAAGSDLAAEPATSSATSTDRSDLAGPAPEETPDDRPTEAGSYAVGQGGAVGESSPGSGAAGEVEGGGSGGVVRAGGPGSGAAGGVEGGGSGGVVGSGRLRPVRPTERLPRQERSRVRRLAVVGIAAAVVAAGVAVALPMLSAPERGAPAPPPAAKPPVSRSAATPSSRHPTGAVPNRGVGRPPSPSGTGRETASPTRRPTATRQASASPFPWESGYQWSPSCPWCSGYPSSYPSAYPTANAAAGS